MPLKSIIAFIVFAGIFLTGNTGLMGQSDTALVGAMYRQAKTEVDKLNFPKAREICDRLIIQLQSRDSFTLSSRIHTLNLQGAMFRHESRYAEAKHVYMEALRTAKSYFPTYSTEQALAYYQMAWINEQAFDMEGWKSYLDTAAAWFQKSFPPEDCWQGRIWQHRARMNFYTFGPPDSTLYFLNKAKAIYQHCPGGAPKSLFDLYKIYYDVFLSARRFDSAEYYLKLQIEYTTTQPGAMWDIQRAWMELSTAHLYRLDGQYEKAISYYQYAKTLFEQADRDTLPLLTCELYTATCLNATGQNQEAFKHFDKLLTLSASYSKLSIDMVGLIYEGLARASASEGRCDSAVYFAEKSLAAFYNMVKPDNPKLLNLYIVYGKCLSQLGRNEKADSILQFAYAIARRSYGNDHPFPTRVNLERCFAAIRRGDLIKGKLLLDSIGADAALSHDPELAYQHILASIDIMTQQHLHDKLSPQHHRELISLLYSAIQRFRDIRNQYVAEEARARTVTTSITGLHGFMPRLFDYYQHHPDDELFQVMLQLSETHRGLLLSEAMGQSDAYALAGVPNELQKKERFFKSGLNRLRKQLEQEYTRAMPKKEYISKLLSEQIAVQFKLDSLIGIFQKKYPDYYRAKFAQETLSLETLQKTLEPDDILVEYLLVKDDLYTFVITRQEKAIYKTTEGQKIAETAGRLIDRLSGYQNEASRQKQMDTLSVALYHELIYPFQSTLHTSSSLIIIPDKFLHYFPFELLQSGRSADMLSGIKKFLIYSYPVQYQSSLLLWHNQSAKMHEPVHHMLTVSPAFPMPQNDTRAQSGLASLEYAGREGESIYRLWGGRWLAEKKATKTKFIRHAPGSDVIHLATHAKADDRSGVFSWLAFSPATKDSLMYVDEIYGLTLYARMVVLSGCETGMGPLQTGEGLISLSRAFSYAGAESIVTSLWPVQDESTAMIMESFYKYLKEGLPKHKALQKAKIEFLENITDPTQADPYYWAGFIAMGDMSPLLISDRRVSLWWWIGIAIAGMTLLWIIRRNIHHRRKIDAAA